MNSRGQALAALAIPAGYQRELAAGRDGEVQLIVDGADAWWPTNLSRSTAWCAREFAPHRPRREPPCR